MLEGRIGPGWDQLGNRTSDEDYVSLRQSLKKRPLNYFKENFYADTAVFGADAASVSKRHCSVRWDAARNVFLLEDHGSTNGTFLTSGERLTPNLMRELHPGDRFFVGDTRNQFEVAFEQ